MNLPFRTRTIASNEEFQNLVQLYETVFLPERVDTLADKIFYHYPGMKERYGYFVEETENNTVVSGLVLIPQQWSMKGIPLCVAEMAMVATAPKYRNKGLIRELNAAFDKTLLKEQYDLAVIQGIPGFYHSFGYYYALPLESQTTIPIDRIPDIINPRFSFRKAGTDDIPFLMREDKEYRNQYLISSVRNEKHWEYLLTCGRETEYGSDFWILYDTKTGIQKYCRIPFKGFGSGLIIGEMSVGGSPDIYAAFLSFCRTLADDQKKTYIRLNMPIEWSRMTYGSHLNDTIPQSYAWQVKIPNILSFISKISPLLEERMKSGPIPSFTGTVRLDLFREKIDMVWKSGSLISVRKEDKQACTHTFWIPKDLFYPLCLGYRTWQQLQFCRPDIAPEEQYAGEIIPGNEITTGQIIDILFPSACSWIYTLY